MTGLYFGSFNPIHTGHLIIAQAMLEHVDEVWFIVSPQNPFKAQQTLMPEEERLHMVRLAVEGNPRLRACDIELRLPRPSYTCLTLDRLREEHPNRQFAIIMGSDNLEGFPRWREADRLLEENRLLVYPRPGHLECPLIGHPHVTLLHDLPHMEISSTHIRALLAAHRSARYLLPDAVWNHLTKKAAP